MSFSTSLRSLALLLGLIPSIAAGVAARVQTTRTYRATTPDGRHIEVALPLLSDRTLFPDPGARQLCDTVADKLRADRRIDPKSLQHGADPDEEDGPDGAAILRSEIADLEKAMAECRSPGGAPGRYGLRTLFRNYTSTMSDSGNSRDDRLKAARVAVAVLRMLLARGELGQRDDVNRSGIPVQLLATVSFKRIPEELGEPLYYRVNAELQGLAYEMCAPKGDPTCWADAKFSQGNALKDAGQWTSKPALYRDAIQAFTDGIAHTRPETDAYNWVALHNALGAALAYLAEWESTNVGKERLHRQAVAAYRMGLKVSEAEGPSYEWAELHLNICASLGPIGAMDGSIQELADAVGDCREALDYWEKHPGESEASAALFNIGNFYHNIYALTRDPSFADKGIGSFRQSLVHAERDGEPLPKAHVQGRLAGLLIEVAAEREQARPDAARALLKDVPGLLKAAEPLLLAAGNTQYVLSDDDRRSLDDIYAKWCAAAARAKDTARTIADCGLILDNQKILRSDRRRLFYVASERGVAFHKKLSFAAALADYDVAMSVDRDNALLRYDRGSVLRGLDRFSDSIVDFDAAISLYRRDAVVSLRSAAKHVLALDLMGARSDAMTAGRKQRMVGIALWRRAASREALGDDNQALADFDQAIAAGSTDALPERGRTRFRRGFFEGATDDFRRALAGRREPYTELWLLLTRARTGKPAEIGWNGIGEPWPGPLTRLFAGSLDPDRARASANGVDQTCEADFYVGEWFLAHAAPARGIALVTRAAETCRKDFIERRQAAAELARQKE